MLPKHIYNPIKRILRCLHLYCKGQSFPAKITQVVQTWNSVQYVISYNLSELHPF